MQWRQGMPVVKLTHAACEKRQAPDNGKGVEYFDATMPGFGLRITPNGAKSFILLASLRGRKRRYTLGRFPQIGLAAARTRAAAHLELIDRGIDPAVHAKEEQEKREREVEKQKLNSVEKVVDEWIKRDQSKNRRSHRVRQLFDREVMPPWNGKQITAVTKADCARLIDSVVDRGAETQARRLHAHLNRMFNWSVGRGIIDANPMTGLPKVGQEVKRDRVLDDAELARAWRAAHREGYPFGVEIKMLILTAARKNEVCQLKFREVDTPRRQIVLKGDRTKTGEPRLLPLSDAAVELIESAAKACGTFQYTTDGDSWLFTCNGKTYSGLGAKPKHRIDAEAAKIDRDGKPLAEPAPIENWRIHDLRRTVATGLQRLGVRQEVTEAVLGHTSGSAGGVVGVYQRHDWADEKREALDAWGRYVDLIVDPERRHLVGALSGAPAERKAFQAAILAGGDEWDKYLAVPGSGVLPENRLTRGSKQGA